MTKDDLVDKFWNIAGVIFWIALFIGLPAWFVFDDNTNDSGSFRGSSVTPYYSDSEIYNYEDGYEWAEDNDISDQDDCEVYSTSFTEGCEDYAEENSNYDEDSYDEDYDEYNSGLEFYGYDCTYDCSGHEAGFGWAEDNNITDPDDCGGNSNSFIEGCEAYAEEYQEDYEDEYDEYDY